MYLYPVTTCIGEPPKTRQKNPIGEEKQRRITYLDRMHSTDGDPRNSHTRKDMSSDLEEPHRERIIQNPLRRSPQGAKADERGHEEKTVSSDESKLDKGECDGVLELVEYLFPGIGGQGRGRVP